MAKTWKDLSYDRMISNERIERATHNAGKGKRQSVSYLKYANNPKKQEGLKRDLENGTYQPLLTEDKIIFDPRSGKNRTIRRPAFRDQIVQHTDCSRFFGQLEALIASMRMKRIVSHAQQKI